jgi:hypothetical protein
MSQNRDMGHPEWWGSQWKVLAEGRGEFGLCWLGGGSFGFAQDDRGIGGVKVGRAVALFAQCPP